MLYWALMFLVIALLAGLFGFGDRLDRDRHGADPVRHRAGSVRRQPVRRLPAAQLLEGSLCRLEVGTQLVARGITGDAIPAVHDGDAKAARRHGMPAGRQLFMKGDLHARHARHRRDGLL